jgi:hypothetical protein
MSVILLILESLNVTKLDNSKTKLELENNILI